MINMSYWTRVFIRILYIFLMIITLLFAFKLAVFYIPFLIAFIISLLMEPLIKWIMNKTKFSRKLSSIIIFILVISLIIGLLTWGIVVLISEASNLLENLNTYVEKIDIILKNITNKFEKTRISLPDKITNIFQNSTSDIIEKGSVLLRNFLNSFLNMITSIPKISIYFAVTILALYFICVDKIYILDQIEYHLPKKWVNKLGRHFKDLIETLGGYLKAQVSLILVSFFISLIGLYFLKMLKFDIAFPLLMALFIGFVDALPILGSGTVMIPWAIISGINGDLKLGIAILILFIVMSFTRQLLEPRLISKHIGTHPIFTLIAMYTGFKTIGIIGMILGPIILIIIKNVFSNFIDKGFVKTILDSK